jgi:hypothetical protein
MPDTDRVGTFSPDASQVEIFYRLAQKALVRALPKARLPKLVGSEQVSFGRGLVNPFTPAKNGGMRYEDKFACLCPLLFPRGDLR